MEGTRSFWSLGWNLGAQRQGERRKRFGEEKRSGEGAGERRGITKLMKSIICYISSVHEGGGGGGRKTDRQNRTRNQEPEAEAGGFQLGFSFFFFFLLSAFFPSYHCLSW